MKTLKRGMGFMSAKLSVSKKIGISLAILSVAAAAVAAGSLAMFNASTESSVVAATGTVQIELSEVELSNFKNINPGDNDPTVPKEASKGTSHKVSYSVTNMGTKSIQTRQTILLTATPNGSKKDLIDARYLKLYDGKKELEDKTYILSNGKEVTKLKDGQKVIAVKYTFFSDSFNGSENAYVVKREDPESEEEYYIIEREDGTDDAFVAADDNGDVSQDYEFDFCLLDSAPNDYQGAKFNIYVAVEALQYRNSLEEDWDEAATVVRGFSTNRKISINSMPSFVEDAEGEEIDLNVSESEANEDLT